MTASRALHPLVMLAAGRSSRLGQPKGLVVVDGRAWVEHQLASFAASGGRRAVIVLGHSRDAYATTLSWIGDATNDVATVEQVRVTIVINDHPDRGPFSSLQIGARALLGDAPPRAAYVLPVDVPAPRLRVWSALESQLTDDIDAVVPVFEGRGGHPVLCGAPFLRDITATACDRVDARLDAKLRASKSVARVDVDDRRVVMNMNTPEDWAAVTRSDG